MSLRKVLVGFLAFVMVSPAWGMEEPVGNVTASSDATVRETTLTPGSTLFTGDAISVSTHGGARIALAGGAQAEVLGDSLVRLKKAENKIQIVVEHGQASFHTSGPNEMTALVADATIRPADGADTSAIIQSLSPTHAVVAAQKGALLVTTAHDGKVYMVPEGSAADLTASPDPPQDGGAIPAGKSSPTVSSPSSKKVVYWTVAIIGAGVIIAAYFLIRGETKLPTSTLQNEISPATLN